MNSPTTNKDTSAPIEAPRVALYAYAASAPEAQPTDALKEQLEHMRQVIVERGWTIVAEYTDTGGSDPARQGLNALFAAVGEKPVPFDKVIVGSPSKLSRNYVLADNYQKVLHQAGVDLVVTDCLDSGNDLLMRIVRMADASYSKDHSARVKRGLAQARARRAASGSSPIDRADKKKVRCNTCAGRGWYVPDEAVSPPITA